MKNALLLKSSLLTVLTCCLIETSAQLASDTPSVSDKGASVTRPNARQDTARASRTLASEAPVLIQAKSKAKEDKHIATKVTLPSEAIINNKGSQAIKQ